MLDEELLYTKILEVNLFAFAYRLFHEDFSPIFGALLCVIRYQLYYTGGLNPISSDPSEEFTIGIRYLRFLPRLTMLLLLLFFFFWGGGGAYESAVMALLHTSYHSGGNKCTSWANWYWVNNMSCKQLASLLTLPILMTRSVNMLQYSNQCVKAG